MKKLNNKLIVSPGVQPGGERLNPGEERMKKQN